MSPYSLDYQHFKWFCSAPEIVHSFIVFVQLKFFNTSCGWSFTMTDVCAYLASAQWEQTGGAGGGACWRKPISWKTHRWTYLIWQKVTATFKVEHFSWYVQGSYISWISMTFPGFQWVYKPCVYVMAHVSKCCSIHSLWGTFFSTAAQHLQQMCDNKHHIGLILSATTQTVFISSFLKLYIQIFLHSRSNEYLYQIWKQALTVASCLKEEQKKTGCLLF